MKFLITGATGMIGSHIRRVCEEMGYSINYLTTDPSKIEKSESYHGFLWDPPSGKIDEKCLEGVDKIIHLAGASVSQRWTKKHRKEILSSRIQTGELLFKTLENNTNQIDQLISASAIGVYPDSMSQMYDENTEFHPNDFLGMVVEEWEKRADKFQELGVAVTKIRIGLVLAREGGLLHEMMKPIKNYVGSYLGNGKQWQSWIHIDDLAALFVYLAEEELTGIFNGVAPNPVKQENMIKTIAKLMDKPLFLPPVPKPVLKLVLGKMASMITSSQLVVSKRLRHTGFTFQYTQLENALRDLIH